METRTKMLTTGTTFAVDDVAPAQTRLKQESLLTSLERRSGRTFINLPHHDKPVVANATFHPLIEAIHRAFADHRPLVLSPDAIWLTIQQGFAHHVNENAEALRPLLVSHEGKRELVVGMESFPTDETWPDAIALWSASVREYIDPQLHAALVCNFSTTTSAIRTASEVALLDAFQRYFDYVLLCICGIPAVTLLGTPDDWRKIRQRIELLEPYDLGWWVSRLRPILDELVKTAEGSPDTKFWQAIYKPAYAYGGDVATGWISDLFPYFGDSGEHYRNDTLAIPRQDWALVSKDDHPMGRAGVSPKTFPSGLACAPITLRPGEFRLNLLAGFLGVTQDAQTGALAPLIGWSVCEPDRIDAFWNRCSGAFPSDAATESHPSCWESLPAELVAFTQRFSRMTLFPNTSHSWELKIPQIGHIAQGTVFAEGPDGWVLCVALSSGPLSTWLQTITLGKYPTVPPDDSHYHQDLTDTRELEGTVLEVLERLIAGRGDLSQL
ncbi:DUF4419 domain-containing protein [Armatimonas rosea]|uniref:DUF4419 domain-containing protein n=1 Tax=Armatimonas rosea TaxID=685828 RepID=A0A7W9STT7_ARMRO|nr:DUF4419 domain-containing protein [Armatimonas rosea]MBB6052722.1 hypothetical protein [Armatimonas rosea]